MVERKRAAWDRDFLLDQAKSGPKPLDLALTLVRWAAEKAKPDPEREPDYMERNRVRLAKPARRRPEADAPASRGGAPRRPPGTLRRAPRGEPGGGG